MNEIRLTTSQIATAAPDQRQQMLRQAAKEVVGATFFAPMLKMARDNALKGKYGHGGRGEEIFGAQLDMELARRASHRLDGGLVDAVVKSLTKRGTEAVESAVQAEQAASVRTGIISEAHSSTS